MQQPFDIEYDRAQQVQKVRKLFPFVLTEKQITYQSIMDLNTLIVQYEYIDNVEKLRNHLNILFAIFYRIIEQLIKIYQIVNISRLNMYNILVDLSNENLPKIHFINLHESDNLLSYDENFQEIQIICMQVLKSHQNQLMKKINDMSDQESIQLQKNQIIKEIHFATTLSNQFLSSLQAPMHSKEIQEFLRQNKIQSSFYSPFKYNNDDNVLQQSDNY